MTEGMRSAPCPCCPGLAPEEALLGVEGCAAFWELFCRLKPLSGSSLPDLLACRQADGLALQALSRSCDASKGGKGALNMHGAGMAGRAARPGGAHLHDAHSILGCLSLVKL